MIPGGYLLLARKLLDSEIMDKPPHYLKLWVWMLGKAFFVNRDNLQRGQLLASIEDMRNACGYRIGARLERPSKDQIRNCYEHFTNTNMITTTKTTRGMIITICNYELYQDMNNYEHHGENSTKTARKPKQSHTIDKECIKNDKEENIIPDWIPREAWDGFIDMRKGLKKPLTGRAVTLAISKLEKLKASGENIEEVLNQSTFKSYLGLFKVQKDFQSQPKNGGFVL